MIRISEPALLGNEFKYVLDVLASNQLSMGRYVQQLEQQLSRASSALYGVATTSGTTALHTALLALGVKPGDRVIVPACSYIATANAVRYCGAVPLFCDVDPITWTLDTQQVSYLAELENPVGVIAVHLYGVRSSGFQFSSRMSKKPWILEDSCEAHGLKLVHDAAVFSFYGNKILTCGEGGAIVTSRRDLDEKCRTIRGQGTSGKQRYIHETLGYNYRMTDLQAAVACAQLETLEEHLAKRAELRDAYEMLLPQHVERQYKPAGSSDWVMPIVVCNRSEVVRYLDSKGIETRPVFPALHLQPVYEGKTLRHFPVSERLADRGLLLPLHLGMTVEDVRYVCRELDQAIRAA